MQLKHFSTVSRQTQLTFLTRRKKKIKYVETFSMELVVQVVTFG